MRYQSIERALWRGPMVARWGDLGLGEVGALGEAEFLRVGGGVHFEGGGVVRAQ
jgi:hypothetical protein